MNVTESMVSQLSTDTQLDIIYPDSDGKPMLLFYDRYGVEEYYIYNPEINQLRGWLRGEYGLDVIESIVNWVSPRLGIRFDSSAEELQIYRPDGSRFSSYIEISQLLEQEQQRAEQAQQQAEAMETLLQQYRERFGELPQSDRES